MIQYLQQIFHSITKSLEVLYVIRGAKPCARILVPEDEVKRVMNFITEKNVHACFSDFKVVKHSSQSNFYSDKSVKIPKNSFQKGHFLAYLSRNKKIAEKAKLAEEKNNHREAGALLGYPECCCDFFAVNFNGESTDLTLKALENSDGHEFPFYSNIAARHFDAAMLSHFPHSFGCRPSIRTAKSNFKIIMKEYKPLADIFLMLLKSAAVYTMEEGIFLLRGCMKAGNGLSYNEVLATAKNKLYFLLSSNRELRIVNKNNFIVGGMEIKGRQYGVMVFK